LKCNKFNFSKQANILNNQSILTRIYFGEEKIMHAENLLKVSDAPYFDENIKKP
jgi:hypothetical protein